MSKGPEGNADLVIESTHGIIASSPGGEFKRARRPRSGKRSVKRAALQVSFNVPAVVLVLQQKSDLLDMREKSQNLQEGGDPRGVVRRGGTPR
jgi:hypothetical protein